MVVAKLRDSIVEIRNVSDLLEIAREVQIREEPLVIQGDAGNEIIVPASPRAKRRKLTPEEKAKADVEAFRSAAGGWNGLIDEETFLRQVREGRSSNRSVGSIEFPDK